MFGIIVETSFSATHQLHGADGTREPRHGHDWRVRACFASPTLTPEDVVLDFHEAQRAVRAAVEAWQYAHLNDRPEFAGRNPSAEVVAAMIFQRIRAAGIPGLRRVEVTEAPDCLAYYEVD